MKSVVEKISANAEEFENLRILVVDDEREILQAYQQISRPRREQRGAAPALRVPAGQGKEPASSVPCRRPRFPVVVARTYEAAIREVKEAVSRGESFAMGFFDVMLGEGPDGFDLVKEIQKLDPQMYAVFVTAYNDRSIESIAQFLGEDRTQKWGLSEQALQPWRDLAKGAQLLPSLQLERRNGSFRVSNSKRPGVG